MRRPHLGNKKNCTEDKLKITLETCNQNFPFFRPSTSTQASGLERRLEQGFQRGKRFEREATRLQFCNEKGN